MIAVTALGDSTVGRAGRRRYQRQRRRRIRQLLEFRDRRRPRSRHRRARRGHLSTFRFGGYDTLSGTSMASPHVTGAAALYIADHPGATPAQVLAGLKDLGELPG